MLPYSYFARLQTQKRVDVCSVSDVRCTWITTAAASLCLCYSTPWWCFWRREDLSGIVSLGSFLPNESMILQNGGFAGWHCPQHAFHMFVCKVSGLSRKLQSLLKLQTPGGHSLPPCLLMLLFMFLSYTVYGFHTFQL